MKIDFLNPRQFTLRKQLTLFLFLLFLSFLLGFITTITFFYPFFIQHPLIISLLYWLIATIFFCIFLILIVSKLTKDTKEMIVVLKELENMNFEVNPNFDSNKDFRIMAESLQSLKDNYHIMISELNDQNHEIKRYSESQKKEFQYKKGLVSTISHEIKTPLTIVHATISGIRDGIFPEEEIAQELENVLAEIEMTTSMLQEIIGVYHIESDEYQLELENVSLNALVSETIEDFKKLIDKYEQNLKMNIQIPITIRVDRKQFKRVLNNILMNAIIYSPKGETISIHLFQSSQNIALEIINTGVEVLDTDMKRLFDPFYRVDQSRTKSDDHGNGLGLYVVKEILKKHEFEFGIENLQNAVKFYILLPQKEKKKKL